MDTYHPQPRAFGDRPRSSQPRSEIPTGPPVSGIVKWFSPEKGFGFIELSDESSDAFLHGTVLAQNRFAIVQPGDTLEVRVGPGHKGPHVTEVLSVDSSTSPPVAARRSTHRLTTSSGPDTAVEETGRVKWFNTAKGYGFITRDNGDDDIFVHVSALERSGLTDLVEGDRVILGVVDGRKGPEAAWVRVA